MTPLRKQMIDDMTLAGLASRTQAAYIKSVEALARYFRRSPADLSEAEVRHYLVDLIKARDVARGTFKTAHYGIQFLYINTLGRDWPLFLKKRFGCPSKNDFLGFYPIPRYELSLAS
ncbi:MAG: phage integrase N-terminal SAM-like domain-containing protein [Magnetococcales bacterium]|nr:phage integrase N-terminal SAM-like domain-containing protein [Magnetococcales bacterium]